MNPLQRNTDGEPTYMNDPLARIGPRAAAIGAHKVVGDRLAPRAAGLLDRVYHLPDHRFDITGDVCFFGHLAHHGLVVVLADFYAPLRQSPEAALLFDQQYL